MSKGKLSLVALIVGVVVMLIPLVSHNHIYQTMTVSSDIKAHSEMIGIITDNQKVGVNIYPMMYIQRGALTQFGDIAANGQAKGVILYPAQYLFGWVFGQADKVFHINPQSIMLWFMFLTLMGVAVTFYAFGRIVSGSGWLLLLIPLLCTTAILGLFTYGVIYSIFNMYIVLPWAILFIAKGLETHKAVWFVAGIIASVLFLILHPTGLYLLFALPMVGVGLGLKSARLKWLGVLGVLVLAAGVFTVWYMGWLKLSVDTKMAFPYFRQFIMEFLSPVTAALGLLTVWALWKYRKDIHLTGMARNALLIIGSFAVVLLGGSLLRLTSFPERIMLDAATMLAVVVALCLGGVMKAKGKPTWFPLTVYGLVGIGVISSVVVWVT